MRKKFSGLIVGLFFIAIAVGFLGNIFDLWNFNLFFNGWWTFFIIVPCIYKIIHTKADFWTLVVFGTGIILLLSAQNVLAQEFLWEIGLMILFFIIGLRIIFGSKKKCKFDFYEFEKNCNCDNEKDKDYIGCKKNQFYNYSESKSQNSDNCAIFGGVDLNYDDLEFNGIETSAIFGGIELDLRKSIINKDCTIKCESIFGGTTIKLPEYVKIKTSSLSIFGGPSNKFISSKDEGAPTIYIDSTNIFGGVEIK